MPTKNCFIEDVVNKAKILEGVGINISSKEVIKLRESMKKLLNERVSKMRFWGKILGKEQDYYIVQIEYKQPQIITKYTAKKDHEPRYNEGANYYVFYATNDLLGDWVELPDVTYEQIRISRLFKYYLSGNLNRKVKSFIDFPGKEAHLLKCTIIRIMHATSIVPEGLLEMKNIENAQEIYGIELNDKLTQNVQGFQLQATNEEIMNAEKWVHEYAYIYNNGKIINLTEENQIPRLESIAKDKRKL